MKGLTIFFLCLILASNKLLEPSAIEPYMFDIEITGNIDSLKPTKLTKRPSGRFPLETYEITMMKASHQFLPKGFPSTTIYAYAGQTKQGLVPSFPGPAIVTMKDTPIEIIWTNNITGSHILPVDVNPPFQIVKEYLDEVPAVPHMHGVQNEQYSDGQPFAYWTISGRRGKQYNSLKSSYKKPNQAIYRYFNNVPGLYWYHDHMIGMTRLNVYSGLAGGVYEVIDSEVSQEERNLIRIYGNLDRKFFAIADKSFHENGALYYPSMSDNDNFTSWVPQFFGNIITVNGKVWPKVKLQSNKYRLVFLNACQSRYLNLYLIDTATQKRISFDLIRVDSDYLRKPLTLQEHFHMIASRIQIVIDLENVKGDIIIKNNAAAPYPTGAPQFLIDKYTGTIMKIEVVRKKDNKIDFNPFSIFKNDFFDSSVRTSLLDEIKERFYEMDPSFDKYNAYTDKIDYSYYPKDTIFNSWPFTEIKSRYLTQVRFPFDKEDYSYRQNRDKKDRIIKQNQNYPTLPEGIPYFPVLLNTQNNLGQTSSIMIDGVSMELGERCRGTTFKVGQTYDFYIINLTEDQHPMHIHLVTFETIARFDFDIEGYRKDYIKLNGPLGERGFSKHPKQLDVRPYLLKSEDANESEKLMTDVVGAPTGKVTQVRVRFESRGDNGFPFDIRGNSYVWHCHILEHEDNEMMRWFCLE